MLENVGDDEEEVKGDEEERRSGRSVWPLGLPVALFFV